MDKDVVKRSKKEKSGIIAGLLLIIISIFMLFLNESRAVDTEKVISDAKDSYIEVSSSKIDEGNNGQLVVTNGKIDLINDNVIDQEFNVNVKSAKLVRMVEMYQWHEECKDDSNGKEVCTYSKKWSNVIVDDSSFESGHVNPDVMSYSYAEFYMPNVNLGEYVLGIDLLQKLSTSEKYSELDEKIAKNKGLNIVDGMYTTYDEDDEIEVGDIRISFLYNNASDISVMGVQQDNTFVKFSPVGTNYEILEIRESIMNGKEFINDLTKSNSTLTWVLRLVGTIIMIAGIASILKFLSFLASFIPLFGKLVVKGIFVVSVLVGTILSLIIIAISWFVVRPVLSIILIVIVVGLIILLRKYNKKNNNDNNETNEVVENK